MDASTKACKSPSDILYSVSADSPGRGQSPGVVTAENRELLLLIPRDSFWLTLVAKSDLRVSASKFDLRAVGPSFDFGEQDRVVDLSLSNFSRFFGLFLSKGALLLFSVTKLGLEPEDFVLERVPPTFQLESFRFPLWKKSCLYFASQKDLFRVDPRVPLECVQPRSKKDFLNLPSPAQQICAFELFSTFETLIADFVTSRVLDLFYVLLESNCVCVVNHLSLTVLSKVLCAPGLPRAGPRPDIRRLFPLLSVKRTDRVDRNDIKSHDFSLRDFLLLLRSDGSLEVVRLKDLKEKTPARPLFAKRVADAVSKSDAVSFALDCQQHFCALTLKGNCFVLRLADHFSQYNKSIHAKGAANADFEAKEDSLEFFSEIAKLPLDSPGARVCWAEAQSYVGFMTMVQNLQTLKSSREAGPKGALQKIHLELDNQQINQAVSKKSGL